MFLPAVFAVALVVRILHLVASSDAPWFPLVMGDAEFFHAWALELAAGDWVGEGVFWYAPLYPYFMGVVYALFGTEMWILRGIQVVIGAGTCTFMAAAANRLWGRRAGIACGVIMALYAPAIYFDALIHKPVLALFFLSIFLWILAGLIDRPKTARSWFGLGLALGFTILARENTMAFALVVPIWLYVHHRAALSGARRLALAATFAAGVLAVVLPVAARNQIVGGEAHLTAANFGDNFYKGNNPGATGTYVPLKPGRANPRFEREDATRMAQEAEGRELSPSEVSAWLTDQSIDYMLDQPGDWLALSLKKAALFFNATELPDTEDIYTWAERSWVLAALKPVFHLGVLAPLALLGILLTWTERRRLWLLYLLGLLYAGSIIAFYVFGRYRYPIVAFLALFAAAGITRLPEWFRTASPGSRAATAAALVAVAVFSNWTFYETDELRAIMHNNVGTNLVEIGDPGAAIPELEAAVTLRSGFADGWYNLGVALERTGRTGPAFEAYKQALVANPKYARAWNNLGTLLVRQKRAAEALEHFEAAARADPTLAGAQSNIGNMLHMAGRTEEAVAHWREALRLDPDHEQARAMLAATSALP